MTGARSLNAALGLAVLVGAASSGPAFATTYNFSYSFIDGAVCESFCIEPLGESLLDYTGNSYVTLVHQGEPRIGAFNDGLGVGRNIDPDFRLTIECRPS